MLKKDCHLLVAGRRHTPGAKAHRDFIDLIAKAKALAYLEAKAKAAVEEFFSSLYSPQIACAFPWGFSPQRVNTPAGDPDSPPG
jgi:hypothetical protein